MEVTLGGQVWSGIRDLGPFELWEWDRSFAVVEAVGTTVPVSVTAVDAYAGSLLVMGPVFAVTGSCDPDEVEVGNGSVCDFQARNDGNEAGDMVLRLEWLAGVARALASPRAVA